MTSETGSNDTDVSPSWLALGNGEAIRWRGTRRVQAVIPAAVVAAVVFAVGVAGLLGIGPIPESFLPSLLGGLGVLVAVLIVLLQYLAVTNTEYVVTTLGMYRKRGIISLRVTAVDYETVQNTSYSQSITGLLFDHGSLSFDTAGNSGSAHEEGSQRPEITFRDIDDPTTVQQLISDQLARARGDDGDDLPGTTEQWLAILDEVRVIRRALETR